MLAIWLCQLNVSFSTLLSIAQLLLLFLQLAQRQHSVVRVQHLSDDNWQIVRVSDQAPSLAFPLVRPASSTRHTAPDLTGRLIDRGYRTAALVILTVQCEDTSWYRLPIWQDQVSSRDFSYLHQQLAFAAIPPVPRKAGVWLRDVLHYFEWPSWR